MKFFQINVNVFTYHDKENCYSKQHSYVCSTKAIFSLNVGLLDLTKYQHAFWLENVDSACNCFACSKCQMSVFHNPNEFKRHTRSCGGKIKDKELTVSRTEDIIDPYFTGDPNVKYLTCTDQMDKFKPTEYFIVYDFETMEELTDNKKEDTTIELENNSSSSSNSS
jgi:hypothetical protein